MLIGNSCLSASLRIANPFIWQKESIIDNAVSIFSFEKRCKNTYLAIIQLKQASVVQMGYS
jgi:hypothetical protein